MEDMSTSADTVGRGAAVAAWTVLATAVVVVAFVGLARFVGAGFEEFSRDASAVLGGAFYTGWFSQLAVMVWNVAAGVALTVAVLLRRSGHRAGARLLGTAGAITAAMALDDLLLLHEAVYPAAGVPEVLVFGLYGAAILVWTAGFRERLGGAVVLVVVAVLCWSASAGLDLVLGDAGSSYLLEDGAKAAGVAVWSVMLLRLVAAEVGPVLRRPEHGTAPGS